MVFVISKNGKVIMPTERHGKVRRLLKEGKAKVVKRTPFTIRLLYETKEYTQDVTLGIDSGYLNVGFSAVTEKKELISGEVKLLEGMKKRIQARLMYRRIRRQRLRYRKPRWQNRKKKEGWLAPSIEHKLDTQIKVIEKLKEIIPISKVIVEVANFDIQKIKNPDIKGEEYQKGEQLDFFNIREYVLHRDGHKCQNPNCKNKSEHPILEVHHLSYRINGATERPADLITLCTKCHTSANHKGFLKNWKPEIKNFKDATFMSIVRWCLVNTLKQKYENVEFTYGYITKNKRIGLKLEKTHYNDAFCIANGNVQKRNEKHYEVTQTRRNNRSLELFYDAKYLDLRDKTVKSGVELGSQRRKRNLKIKFDNLRQFRGHKISKGRRSIRIQHYMLQPNDLVRYEGKTYEVAGVQNKGTYVKLRGLKKVPNINTVKVVTYGKGIVFRLRELKESM